MDYKIKKSQLAILFFILTTCFKYAMLPSYISSVAENQGYITVAVFMLFDFIIFGFVYYVMINGGLRNIGLPHWALSIICLILFSFIFLKLIVYLSESLSYISLFLFDIGQWRLITLIGLLILSYVAFKGLRTIARLSNIFVWIFLFTLIFDIVFADIQIDMTNILPFCPDGAKPIFDAGISNIVWFGNLIMFLFIDFREEKGKNFYLPLSMLISFCVTVAFFLVFYGIYGNMTDEIPYVFSKLASLNTLSEDLGNFQWPTIISWLIATGIGLSLFIFFGGVCINETFKLDKHSYAGKIFVVVAVFLIIYFLLTDMSKTYSFVTGNIKYYSMAVSYSLPIIVALYVFIRNILLKRKNPNNKVMKNELEIS